MPGAGADGKLLAVQADDVYLGGGLHTDGSHPDRMGAGDGGLQTGDMPVHADFGVPIRDRAQEQRSWFTPLCD